MEFPGIHIYLELEGLFTKNSLKTNFGMARISRTESNSGVRQKVKKIFIYCILEPKKSFYHEIRKTLFLIDFFFSHNF